jgi:hypothetical protein
MPDDDTMALVDLGYRDLALLTELLQKERTTLSTSMALPPHVGHFPETVKRIQDIDGTALAHCHNKWCSIGQINMTLDNIQAVRNTIEERVKLELKGPAAVYAAETDDAIAHRRVTRQRGNSKRRK